MAELESARRAISALVKQGAHVCPIGLAECGNPLRAIAGWCTPCLLLVTEELDRTFPSILRRTWINEAPSKFWGFIDGGRVLEIGQVLAGSGLPKLSTVTGTRWILYYLVALLQALRSMSLPWNSE